MRLPKLKFNDLPVPLIGVDEVGRGCLAGPVTAAAVIFKSAKDTRKYKDSKKLTLEQREELSLSIHEHHFVAIGWASVEEIDQINILRASLLAMRRAVEELRHRSGSILVDGNFIIPDFAGFEQRAIVKGDDRVRLISAASIAAKVARDRFMQKLALEFGDYGFDQHKGYGTPEHRRQIQSLGPCLWHRKSFAGVKEHLGPGGPARSSR